MRALHIHLSEELYFELVNAAADSHELDERVLSPNEFAKECVEAVLAERRLERISSRVFERRAYEA